ncbi:Inorganic pyrophosphatase [hydrothermal vent metagenome]|uniref:inorganic diphosphatase n=1 Tax=hydrothermal vent metagenome TaxID=652676 RepID=A0A3B1DIS7_9ZZZZ
MSMKKGKDWDLMRHYFRAHPWHGIPSGDDVPKIVNTYIETVPSDTVKYELDKDTGLLKVDRPQKFSNVCPTLYGLIPQTFCGQRVAEFCRQKTGDSGITGDNDPLDICVLTEKNISHGDILLRAIPIGGLRMIDGGEADDKIIAIMTGDDLYGKWKDIHDCPEAFINRLRHYFLTYKDFPDNHPNAKKNCEITHVYDKQEAYEVIRLSQEDYQVRFEGLQKE